MTLSRDIYRELEDIVGPKGISEDPVVLDGYAYQRLGQLEWRIEKTFSIKPEAVVLPRSTKEVQAIIKPPDNVIAGDYLVTFTASTTDTLASGNVAVRVTVLTPTTWGWVGVGVVLLVVGGLVLVFLKLGRR